MIITATSSIGDYLLTILRKLAGIPAFILSEWCPDREQRKVGT
jgi:hypothetical protein